MRIDQLLATGAIVFLVIEVSALPIASKRFSVYSAFQSAKHPRVEDMPVFLGSFEICHTVSGSGNSQRPTTQIP